MRKEKGIKMFLAMVILFFGIIAFTIKEDLKFYSKARKIEEKLEKNREHKHV